ncbi:MAG TPA: DUF4097 family beta strand repeat-containing protein, partial [Thermoanaerobaculia bacterium]|nr:DUF4097 family beta strand repeat-containing protein [Thermoanaerobaculia bacterium]
RADGASLLTMSARRDADSRSDRTDRAVLWFLLALGVALMLLAAGTARGEETASRTDRISATLPAGATVRLDNVSGDVIAVPGREFLAVATIVVAAPDRARARDVLEKVRIVQRREGDVLSIETRWPESRWRLERTDGRSGRRRLLARCEDCRINARYEVTIPPGVEAILGTVNGDVRARDLDGDLRLRTVNGRVEATGVRRSLDAKSVNGDVVGSAVAAPAGAAYELETVNGAVRLTLPKDARFDLSASTMHGSIASTFALPRGEGSDEEVLLRRHQEKLEKKPVRRIVVRRKDGEEDVVVDLKELEKELEESMKDVDVEIRRAIRSVEEGVSQSVREGVAEGIRQGVRGGVRGMRALALLDPRRSYSGRVGDGGATVRLSALNGSILLLASGSRPEDAKPIVSQRRSFTVTIPEVRVRVPEVPAAPQPVVAVPRAPRAPRGVWTFEAPVVRGDIAGDFLATSGTSSYRIGNVSGRVKILTHSGEISLASAGGDADVKTFGGDIRLGPVKGDLAAQTLAGDVRVGTVAGSARVETSGGDIRIQSVDGWLRARTAGGDIVVPLVGGHVDAATAGGDVRIAVGARQLKEAISIVNGGGDVALVLPADFKGELDLTVTDADPSEPAIRSEFPEVSISRKNGTVHATGSVNGGGEKVKVSTSSGTIRLSRGPAAQK